MLNPQQNKAILKQLKTAGLKYQEVYEELLDHYTSAIESKMETEDISFDKALQKVHTDFGKAAGLRHIEKRYYSQIWKFYRHLHWQNLRIHFKWPQAVLTLCMGGLVYALSYLLKGNAFLFYGLSLVAFIPFALSIFYFFKLRNNATYSKKTAKGNLLMAIGSYGLNLLNLLIFVPRAFLNETIGKEMVILYPALVSLITTIYLLHLLSFIKTLERVKFTTS